MSIASRGRDNNLVIGFIKAIAQNPVIVASSIASMRGRFEV
jgi:hypothetical protein